MDPHEFLLQFSRNWMLFEECILEWKCVGSDFLFVERGSFRCKLIIQCECFWFQGSDTLRVIEGVKMSC